MEQVDHCDGFRFKLRRTSLRVSGEGLYTVTAALVCQPLKSEKKTLLSVRLTDKHLESGIWQTSGLWASARGLELCATTVVYYHRPPKTFSKISEL